LTTQASVETTDIEKALLECFYEITNHFGVKIDNTQFATSPFPDKQGLVMQIRVPYQGPLLSHGSLPRIKLDISKDEILVQSPIHLPLLHDYSDHLLCAIEVQCYSLYEIFAEKLRALVQRTRPRDLYDVVHLGDFFKEKKADEKMLREVSKKKFSFRGLIYPDSLHEIPHNIFEETRADWNIMLAHQVNDLESIDVYLERFRKLLKWINTAT
jgi:hypothetical protein